LSLEHSTRNSQNRQIYWCGTDWCRARGSCSTHFVQEYEEWFHEAWQRSKFF